MKITAKLSILYCLLSATGCIKTPELPGAVSLTIINTQRSSIILNFNEEDSIYYGNRGTNQVLAPNIALEYSLTASSQRVNLHELKTANPPHVWVDTSMLKMFFQLPMGTVGSLFVAGTPAVPDTLFIKDTPAHFPITDSSMGIRFVNLSGAKTAVSINLQGQPPGSEAAGLLYKNVTAFRTYKAIPSVQQYVFEVRDAATGQLLASNTINNPGVTAAVNQWRYHNFTLVYSGVPGAPGNLPAAFIVKNY